MEKKFERPLGGREGDFSELNNWTITDIATTPGISDEDRKNAEAEISKREVNGTYNLEDGSERKGTRDDLLTHGYGLEEGKILYPKQQYKAWMESGGKMLRPKGIVRESISDRLEEERRAKEASIEASRQQRESTNWKNWREQQSINLDETIRDYEDEPHRVKIQHPKRFTKEQKPIGKQNDSKIDRERSPADKVFNYYKYNFSKKNIVKWLSFGVSKYLEKGALNLSPNVLLHSGFLQKEGDRIHERLDPNDTFTEDNIESEGKAKLRIEKELIDVKSKDITDEEYREGRYRGLLRAIKVGARKDVRNGEIIYSFPPDIGEDVYDYMKDSGVDFAKRDNNKALRLSYQGFANIIDAIKNEGGKNEESGTLDRETEKGFKALDWYFDSFHYGKKEIYMIDFLSEMSVFQDNNDDAWNNKFEQYCEYREETRKYIEDLERRATQVPELKEVREIDLDLEQLKEYEESTKERLLDTERLRKYRELIEEDEELSSKQRREYDELLKKLNNSQWPQNLRIFPDIEQFPIVNFGSGSSSIYYPMGLPRLSKAISEFSTIKQHIDQNASIYKCVFTDSQQKNIDYLLISFMHNNTNVAITVPVDSRSYNASYVWIENKDSDKKAKGATGWMDAFMGNNSDSMTSTSKYRARLRNDVWAHYHVAKKVKNKDGGSRTINPVENMWLNIWARLNSYTRNNINSSSSGDSNNSSIKQAV